VYICDFVILLHSYWWYSG